MKSLERIVLYVLACIVAVSMLDRAGAQDPNVPEQQQQQEAMRVPTLEIHNAQGTTVIRLSAAPDGNGQIEIFSKDGKRAAQLFAHKKGGMLTALNTDTGKGTLYAGTASDTGNAMLTLRNAADIICTGFFTSDKGGYARYYNEKGKLAAFIGSESGENTGGYLAMFGPTGNKAIEAYVHEKGGLLSLMEAKNKKSVVSIGAASDTGTGLLNLANTDGKRGILSFVGKDGGVTRHYNKDGKTAVYQAVRPDGTGYIYAARADGSSVVELGRNSHLGGYLAILNGLNKRVVYLGATTNQPQGDGVLEISRNNGKVGVALRAVMSGSFVQVYDSEGKPKNSLR